MDKIAYKEYMKQYNKKYYIENKERIKAETKQYCDNNKDKTKAIQKAYREANKDKIKDKLSNYYQTNKDKLKTYAKEYREANKDKIRINLRKYKKERKKNDILFMLQNKYRNIIYKALTKKGYVKKETLFNILGCTIEQFKEHLEANFKDWMSWDNYGLYNGTENYGWDIDHINPISNSTTENDILKLNHYTNLQPLCSKVNRDIKKNKIGVF